MGDQISVQPEIDITEKAVKQVFRLKEENNIPSDYALRVGVKGGGCSGLTYQLGFDGEVKDGDTIIEKDGLKLCVD